MSYQQGPYGFHETQHIPPNMFFPHHDGQYPTFTPAMYVTHPVYNQYGYPTEMVDYATLAMMGDDFEDPNETTTRPRLTKEQVDILEAQFQEHPKPNSQTKRQLAMQTKLTLPRVANWFQNRRAKAKQQRKQEEYESQNQLEARRQQEASQDAAEDEDDDSEETKHGARSSSPPPPPPPAVPARSSQSRPVQSPVRSQLRQHTVHDQSAKAAAQASLQRALASAQASRHEHLMNQPQYTYDSGVYSSRMHAPSSQPPFVPVSGAAVVDTSTLPWARQSSNWAPSQAGDMQFDFGFDQQTSESPANSVVSVAPSDSVSQGYVVSQDDWDTALVTPTMPRFLQHSSDHVLASPPTATPTYIAARRGSGGAELLSTNLETFNFTASPAPPLSQAASCAASSTSQGSDTTVDIAARRKRPRPAALTSASLRSRSYGQLSGAASASASRTGMAIPTHALRHAKSAGHGLSSHYAGVRKASLPTKSPLAISTFAEAEAFHQLMAEKRSDSGRVTQAPMPVQQSTPVYSVPELMQQTTMTQLPTPATVSQLQSQFSTLHSPPVTPFNPEMTMQAAAMLPPSVQSQYATFNDFTPPYSAGPLTSTSWSDPPLVSPDLAQFSSLSYTPYVGYPAPPEDHVPTTSWTSPGSNLDLRLSASLDNKRAEFFHHEFPGQKEEHAEIAKKLPPQTPKMFQFSNTSITDYGD